jgi:hypothetical protein
MPSLSGRVRAEAGQTSSPESARQKIALPIVSF